MGAQSKLAITVYELRFLNQEIDIRLLTKIVIALIEQKLSEV